MVGGQAQHQVGVDELALVAGALVVVQARERRPVALAGGGEGPGALPVGDAPFPVQPGPAALERRHDPAQLGMDPGAVVALVVVLGDQLPVGPHPVGEPPPDGQRLQRVARQPLGHRAELVGQGHRLARGQVEEHEPAPGRHPHRVEPEGRLVEAVDVLAPGGAQQVALQPVGPGVVRAAQRPGLAGRPGLGTARLRRRARHHLGAAVAADVVVGPQLPRPGPDQQDALAGHLHHLQRPRPLDLVGPPGAEPLAVQQPLPFPPEGRLVEVVGCGQGALQAGQAPHLLVLGPRSGG